MSRRVRAVLVACCAVVVIVCGVALGLLRSGRPLFYTDGANAYRADALADRSMLVWQMPEVLFELPGKTRGRTARLPDGRVVFARVEDDESTDLFVFDPSRPELPSVALTALNVSERHDMAPAVGVDGRLYFASDREGGAGGFDLYVAEQRGGRFLAPERLDDTINSEADEIDPAPHPGGGAVAFVRRAAGDPGTDLWIGTIDSEEVARRLFDGERERDDFERIDRDPVFAPDGTALWFVRQTRGSDPIVQRTWRHADDDGGERYVEPIAEARLGAFRAPTPRGDGFVVELIKPGDVALVYAAKAREVYPWWDGQSGLELLLLIVGLVALLLILLLLLGNRWRQLDIITWCIIISALVHLLILMIVAGMQVTYDEVSDEGEGDRLEVRFLSAAEAGAAGGGSGRESDVHREIAFQGRAHQESVAAPSAAALAGSRAAPQVDAGVRAGAEVPDAAVADRAESALRDQVAAIAPNAGSDGALAATAAQSTEIREQAASNAQLGARSASVSTALEVVVPRSSAGGGGLAPAPAAAPIARGSRAAGVSTPVAAAPRVTAMRDAVQAVQASDAASELLAVARPAQENRRGPADAQLEVARSSQRAAAGTSRLSRPAPASSLMPTKRRRVRTPSARRVAMAPSRPASSLAPAPLRAARPDRSAPQRRTGSDPELAASRMRAPTRSTRPGVAAAELEPKRARLRVGRSDLATRDLPKPPSFLARAPERQIEMPRAETLVATPALYRNRTGPGKQQALERFGGTAATEAAVAAGLAYLANSQRRGGYWGSRRSRHEKYGSVYVGKTALCVLAFLGAGHTHESDSLYSENVADALQALLATQDEETGHFGRSSAYSHGITTYALAECYALTKDSALRAPLRDAVAWILENQNRGGDPRSRGGWGYFSADLRPEDRFARTSVSSWMIMALKSADIGGLDVPQSAFDEAKAFCWRMFDARRDYFLYSKEPGRLRSNWRTLPASTPAAAFCLMLLGERPDDRIDSALEYIIDRKPERYRRYSTDAFVRRGAGNVYFWYYSSLATLLAGGDAWDEWNDSLKEVLVPAQNEDGSFSPVGSYANYAGDDRDDMSYTTAMIVLSLEVYYRYFTPLLNER